MMRIAFLFLLIDNPNFPDIWDKYFLGKQDKYDIFIHPKFPEKHTWRPQNIIKNLKETGWGHVTSAYVALMETAYKNGENVKFILVSESCVPIKSFDIFYTDCMKDLNKSWIKLMKISKYDYEYRVLTHIKYVKENRKDIKIPKLSHIIKHYARFCLRREDVKKVLTAKYEGRMKFFNTMHVGDEFFLTVITPLHKNEFVDFEVTYDDWDYTHKIIKEIDKLLLQAYENFESDKSTKKEKANAQVQIEELRILKSHEASHPKTIIDVREDLNSIKRVKSYFYRKFAKNSNIREYWDEIIEENNKN